VEVGTVWRLAELVDLANRVLPEEEGESRRVQWAPNERLVRYYTSLGLLDRPAEMRGRTAYYGTRHLLQLLAIKRLQLDGMTLRAVQQYLTGLPDGELEEAAGLTSGWRSTLDAPPPPSPVETPFWERAPRTPAPPPPPAPPPATLSGVVLGPDLILLVRPEVLENLDPDELRRAAEPLLKLIGPVPGPENHD
jgi:DNA-binding transcriptional MerR regulator